MSIKEKAIAAGKKAVAKGWDCCAFDRDFMIWLESLPKKTDKREVVAWWAEGYNEEKERING